VIQRLRELGTAVQEVIQPLEALADADEAIITNALMPILPVRQIGNWHYSSRQLFTLLHPQDD
jgi:4-amino-4-deoxychorismate lyase